MTQKKITLSINHPSIPDGPIQGFRFFWACYVNGFRPETRCQVCLKGKRIGELSTGYASSGRSYDLEGMDRYPYVYICGVGAGPKNERYRKNLHLPLKYAHGETVTVQTYNGYVMEAQNAAALPIPPLPDGWMGIRDVETTRCKNFQFGVAYFGYDRPAK